MTWRLRYQPHWLLHWCSLWQQVVTITKYIWPTFLKKKTVTYLLDLCHTLKFCHYGTIRRVLSLFLALILIVLHPQIVLHHTFCKHLLLLFLKCFIFDFWPKNKYGMTIFMWSFCKVNEPWWEMDDNSKQGKGISNYCIFHGMCCGTMVYWCNT